MLTEADKTKRIGKITSSTAAGCLGLDERMTPIGAWLLITGQTPAEQPDPAWEKAVERGNLLEDAILEYPCDELTLAHGVHVIRTRAPFRRHPKYDWTGDSADALYFPDNGHVDVNDPWADLLAIGEGKSAAMGVFRDYGDEGTDEMPHHTLVQSHFHLVHWPEVNECWVPVLGGGYRFEFRNLLVERDEEFEGLMMQDLERWHRDYIIGGKMPPAEAGDGKYLRGHCSHSPVATPDTLEIKDLAFAKASAARDKKTAARHEDTAKNKLIQILCNADAECVKASWGKVTYNQPQDTYKTDWRLAVYELMDWFQVPMSERNALIARCSAYKENSRRLLVTLNKQTKKELGL
jgi:hypothetical protein